MAFAAEGTTAAGPPAPTSVRLTAAGAGTATVAWTAPAATVTGYELLTDTDGDQDPDNVNPTGTTSPAPMQGLPVDRGRSPSPCAPGGPPGSDGLLGVERTIHPPLPHAGRLHRPPVPRLRRPGPHHRRAQRPGAPALTGGDLPVGPHRCGHRVQHLGPGPGTDHPPLPGVLPAPPRHPRSRLLGRPLPSRGLAHQHLRLLRRLTGVQAALRHPLQPAVRRAHLREHPRPSR